MKEILILGASSGIGLNLTQKLLNNGHRVLQHIVKTILI